LWVYPSIYSLVECTCIVGSNRLNQGPRCIKRDGGGSFRKSRVKTLKGAPADARVGPVGPTWQPPGFPLLRVSSRSFLSLPVMFPMADKFRVYSALESLFSAFVKFTLENTEYAKLIEIVSLNPILVCIHVLLRV